MKTNRVAVAALIAAVAAPAAFAQEAVQWRVEDGGNGHWYAIKVTNQSLTWYSARSVAISLGGDLAAVQSAAVQDFIDPLLLSASDEGGCHPAIYIGLITFPGTPWTWIDGSPLEYSRWFCGEPTDPDYSSGKVVMYNPSACEEYCEPHLYWNDVSAIDAHPLHRGYVIEWSADCNGDGIVDYGQILDGTFEDANANGVPDCCDEGVSCDPCLGDVNNDGQVNGADISVLLGFWGLNGKPVAADINKDGSVDGADLAQLLGSWGECP